MSRSAGKAHHQLWPGNLPYAVWGEFSPMHIMSIDNWVLRGAGEVLAPTKNVGIELRKKENIELGAEAVLSHFIRSG